MKLLLDINVTMNVVFDRPSAATSSALIATCGRQNRPRLPRHSVATLSYLFEREKDAATARAVITDLLTWAQVATTGHSDALQALQLPMADFEDALQVTVAQACGASYIITRNVRDFAKSPVAALTPEKYLEMRVSS